MINKDIVPLINKSSALKRMLDYFDAVDSIFDEFFSLPAVSCCKSPLVNFKEDLENYYLQIAAPGLSKDSISVVVEDDYLEVKATSSDTKEDEKKEKYYVKEFSSFSFSKRVSIPKDVDKDKIKASYENGILNIVLPKNEKSKPRIVDVS